jgi:ArsR family transcriptional regulator, arsenate/arsenite/antimonite-responsive transcriptional repressor
MPTTLSAVSTLGLGDAAADRVFKALASGPRREILSLLASSAGTPDERCCSPSEVCACVLSERLGLGAPTVSHHMKALIDAGLVASEKRGLWVYYRLLPDALRGLAETLSAIADSADVTERTPR